MKQLKLDEPMEQI